jgi:hypothetical protein
MLGAIYPQKFFKSINYFEGLETANRTGDRSGGVQ